jgi:hypothetical protein
VLGRVMPFEPLDEPTRFGCGKGPVERGRGVKIVLDEHDPFGVGEMRVGHLDVTPFAVPTAKRKGRLSGRPFSNAEGCWGQRCVLETFSRPCILRLHD